MLRHLHKSEAKAGPLQKERNLKQEQFRLDISRLHIILQELWTDLYS